ncbi:MAG: phosphatidylglycerophosphatase A [Gammaproteobacteria bacterium]|nr:MAG: phosphatidylglycerophosphatase A [Gammaproteobacteria bacterium]
MTTSGKRPKLPAHAWRNPVHWLAFGLGLGALPYAPGTFGTLLGVALYLAMQSLPLWQYLALTSLLFVTGIALCASAARALGVRDHPGIVWDEAVGYLITMFAAPPGWAWMLAGFILFRLFDIWKPWPVRLCDQKIHGGFGIMLDDALAALYSMLVLHSGYFLYGQI